MSAGKKELILEYCYKNFMLLWKKWLGFFTEEIIFDGDSLRAIHNTPGKCFTKAFIPMVTLWDFTHRLKHYSHRTQHNDKYHKKVLLGSFHYFERSHSRISIKKHLVGHNNQYSATGECCSALSFHWEDFIHRPQIKWCKLMFFFWH